MLLRSGFIVAIYTFLSRILGLAREVFIADMFGAGSTADSVNVAFKLPNLFRRIFAEGALASVFVPMFSAKLVESKGEAEKFASKIFWLLLGSLAILTGLMQYFMPYLMIIIAPGFHGSVEKFNLTILLCRITMPYLIFISLAALMGGMLNSVKKFWPFAFAPVLFNVFIIAGTMGMDGYIDKPEAVSYSVILCGIAQVIFMAVCTRNAGFTLKSPQIFHTNDWDVTKLLRLMIPATISSSALQLNIFISQSIASFIPGAVSILSYAERIYQFPLSIIGIAFGTVLLPELSKLYKAGDKTATVTTQNNAIKFALLLSIPCTIGIMMLSKEIIHLIYERGAFTSEDTAKTSAAMSAFTAGLPAFILTKIFTPIFYANHDTKTPMKITIYALSFNTIANIILMQFMGAMGIALGSSIAAWYNVWLLIKYAKNHGYFSITPDTKSFVIKILLCSTLMGLVIYMVSRWIGDGYFDDSSLIKASYMALTISISCAVYLAALAGCGIINRDFIKLVLKR